MTVYGLIELMTAACGPTASFGDVRLWWDVKAERLYLAKSKPNANCKDLAIVERGEGL